MIKTMFNGRNTSNHGLLLWSFIVLIIAVSFASFTTISNYVMYPIWALWLSYILRLSSVLSKDEKVFVKVSFVFLAIVCFYLIIGYSSMKIGLLLREINWIMAGVVAVYAVKTFSSKELSSTYFFMTICLILLMIVYVILGREIMSVDEEMTATVDSAWYGSLFMLLSGLSLIVFLNIRKLVPRFLSLVALFLTIYLNFFVFQRGTVVLFTMAELGLILVFILKNRTLITSLSIIIIIFVVITLPTDNMITLFDWLAQVSPSERLSVRFDQISLALRYEDINAGGGSLAGRNSLLEISWGTFTSSIGHFFFGAGEHANNNMVIGHHSFILDTLAKYGVMGGVLMFVYFKKQYQIIMAYLDRKKNWSLYMQCAVVFAFYVFRNYFGSLATDFTNLFLLLFFPLTLQIINYYKIIEK